MCMRGEGYCQLLHYIIYNYGVFQDLFNCSSKTTVHVAAKVHCIWFGRGISSLVAVTFCFVAHSLPFSFTKHF